MISKFWNVYRLCLLKYCSTAKLMVDGNRKKLKGEMSINFHGSIWNTVGSESYKNKSQIIFNNKILIFKTIIAFA